MIKMKIGTGDRNPIYLDFDNVDAVNDFLMRNRHLGVQVTYDLTIYPDDKRKIYNIIPQISEDYKEEMNQYTFDNLE